MSKSRPKLAPQFSHALCGKSHHEGTERKLIDVAAPMLNPAQLGFRVATIGDADLRYQYRVVAKRRENHVIDRVVVDGNLLTKIPHPEDTIEVRRVSWIERAQHRLAICQITKASAKKPLARRVVIQEFRSYL